MLGNPDRDRARGGLPAELWGTRFAGAAVGSLTLRDLPAVGFPTLKLRRSDAESGHMVDGDNIPQPLPPRRIATRYMVRIPVGLHVRGQVLDGLIVDLSDSGARLECDPPGVPPGTSVSLELRCFRVEERISMIATLVRESSAGCALRWVEADPFLRVFVKLARLYDEAPGERLEKLLSEL